MFLDKMCCVDETNPKINDPLLEKIRLGLKNPDWRKRFDAKNLYEELSSQSDADDYDFDILEAKYLDTLKKNMWARYPELFDLYSKANMTQEVLEMALAERDAFEEKYNGKISEENFNSYDVLLGHLGKSYMERHSFSFHLQIIFYLFFFFLKEEPIVRQGII